tara:strand:- start:1859 stop:2623 length:765 start_codon:yes stop_codon:yes gene_type:complete
MSLAIIIVGLMAATPCAEPTYKTLSHVVDSNESVWHKPLASPSEMYIRVYGGKAPLDITDDEIIFQALNSCKNANRKRRGDSQLKHRAMHANDEQLLRRLLDIEKSFGVPSSLRGILLAAACHESGYNPQALGDRKFDKNRRPRAQGLFQMWKWWEKAYGIDRTDPYRSASAYMTHVVKKLKKVKRQCDQRLVRKDKNAWLIAWATAIRSPKPAGRCHERPLFYRVLKQWHRNIKTYRKQILECGQGGYDGCGC